MTVGSLILEPSFEDSILTYEANTSNATNKITATPDDVGAVIAITVNDVAHVNDTAATWLTGLNTVVITVTNGAEVKVYTVYVTKA